MRIFSYLFLITILISACSQDKIDTNKAIQGIWRMSESIDKKKVKHSDDPLLNEAKKLEEGKEGHVLSIFPDNSFTELAGKRSYSYGTWKWLEEGKIIEFNHSNHKKFIYTVAFDTKDTNNILANFSNSSKQLSFIKEAKLFDSYKEEPFYAEHNQWRIKPTKSENKAQLLERLGNYFEHMAYLLKAADERNLEVISFEFSMGIVKIYNGGIGIHEFDVLPVEWKDTYYNDEDLKVVYSLFYDYLQDNRYRGASTGEWVKDDYTILLSIYNDLKSGKF